MALIKIKDLPENERIYLKKDMFGYRIVQPIKNEDGSFNWINLIFGGWRNLVSLIALLALIGFLIYSHFHDVQAIQSNYEVISANPLAWCKDICKGNTGWIAPKLNFSGLT